MLSEGEASLTSQLEKLQGIHVLTSILVVCTFGSSNFQPSQYYMCYSNICILFLRQRLQRRLLVYKQSQWSNQ